MGEEHPADPREGAEQVEEDQQLSDHRGFPGGGSGVAGDSIGGQMIGPYGWISRPVAADREPDTGLLALAGVAALGVVLGGRSRRLKNAAT